MIEIAILVIINTAISFWNARVCGLAWKDIPVMGTFTRLVLYSAATMSAIGFSSVVLIFSSVVLSLFLDAQQTALLLSWSSKLFYVMVIVPVLGTGLIITLHSWISLWKERSWMNLATTSWNTFAQIKNSYNAYHSLGPALESVSDMFGAIMTSDGEDGSKAAVARLAVALVLVSIVGGVFITVLIIKHYMSKASIPSAFYEERIA